MKNARNIVLYALMLTITIHNHSFAAAAGVKAVQEFQQTVMADLTDALKNAGSESLKDNMPALADALKNTGGAFGTEALQMIGGAGVAVGAAAGKVGATIKAGAVAIAASPATPVVIVVAVAGTGSYMIYKSWNPSLEQIVRREELKALLEQAKARAEQAKTQVVQAQLDAMELQIKHEALKAADNFKNCLKTHSISTEVPVACNKVAFAFALAAGAKAVDEVIANASRYSA